VGLFWADETQDITHTICALDPAQVITAACDFLTRTEIEEPDYQDFLLQRLRAWDGKDVHITTLKHGKLAIFPTAIHDETMLPVFRKRPEIPELRVVHGSVAPRRHSAIDDDLGSGDEARFVGSQK
jgi:hypothetical protein